MSDLKLYGVSLQVSDAAGYQTFGVMASSEKDAMHRFKLGESTGEMLDHEVEVIGLDSSFGIDDVEPYFDWKPDVRASKTIKQQSETIDKLVEAFQSVKLIALQEREWRKEDSDCGVCEVKESVESLSSKIDALLATIKGE